MASSESARWTTATMGGGGVVRWHQVSRHGGAQVTGRGWSHMMVSGELACWSTATGVIWEGVELYDGIK